jgi:hypothetical protein
MVANVDAIPDARPEPNEIARCALARVIERVTNALAIAVHAAC